MVSYLNPDGCLLSTNRIKGYAHEGVISLEPGVCNSGKVANRPIRPTKLAMSNKRRFFCIALNYQPN